ncbi:endonuclease-reverse transcriptase [Plakobranchus ocellatus]|uniref:Endonuclease-reverse transcriptase n=1 Tax=Plakobranchus ocellatus TaxID=259542 RepID=A0AAV4B9E3_9GAST|nr:endonuclease-reverse transcriptase [Plakobranchus ocellatus]
MKRGKAEGPDDIPSEMLSAPCEFVVTEITELLNTIHSTGEIPTDLKKSVYIAPPKKTRHSGMRLAPQNKSYEPPRPVTSADEQNEKQNPT